MMYFAGCKNKADIETRYKQWVKVLHPDKDGGNTQQFQNMQSEYDLIISGKIKKPKKPVQEVEKENIDIMQKTNDFFNMANNLVLMVRQSITLAKEINVLIEKDEQVNNIINDKK